MDAIVYTMHINNDINKINSFLGIIQNVIKSPVQCCEAALFHKDIVEEYREKMIITYGL